MTTSLYEKLKPEDQKAIDFMVKAVLSDGVIPCVAEEKAALIARTRESLSSDVSIINKVYQEKIALYQKDKNAGAGFNASFGPGIIANLSDLDSLQCNAPAALETPIQR